MPNTDTSAAHRNTGAAHGSDLPAVGGRRLPGSNNEFEHRCLIYLAREQEKIAPDNGLIALLCDAVRCVREYNDAMQSRFDDGPNVAGERPAKGTDHE